MSLGEMDGASLAHLFHLVVLQKRTRLVEWVAGLPSPMFRRSPQLVRGHRISGFISNVLHACSGFFFTLQYIFERPLSFGLMHLPSRLFPKEEFHYF